MKSLKLSAVALGVLTLTTGFILVESPEESVEAFINQTKQQTTPPPLDLGKLPEEKPYEPYKYESPTSPFDLKPFAQEVRADKPEEQPVDTGPKKEPECTQCSVGAPKPHQHYFLENYDLSQLTMVGTIKHGKKKGELIGLIKTPVGVYQVKKGEYIGKNNGLVNSITKTQITITEKHQLPGGTWNDAGQVMKLFEF